VVPILSLLVRSRLTLCRSAWSLFPTRAYASRRSTACHTRFPGMNCLISFGPNRRGLSPSGWGSRTLVWRRLADGLTCCCHLVGTGQNSGRAKRSGKPQLPTRGPGMSDRIVLGRDRWSWGPEPVDFSTPDPSVPTFAETLENLAVRLRKQIGTVRRTRDFGTAHPRVQKLPDADEQRRARQVESPYATYDAPVFEPASRNVGSGS
jgi:hypothetical protein